MQPGFRIAIVGNDAEAWTVAAVLGHALRGEKPSITVFGTQRAAEAGVPSIALSPAAAKHLQTMGINTLEGGGSVLVGNAFEVTEGVHGTVSFENAVPMINGVGLHHYLHRMSSVVDLSAYSIAARTLATDRCPSPSDAHRAGLVHGFCVSGKWYMDTVRAVAVSHGARIANEHVLRTSIDSASGQIVALATESQSHPVDFVFDLTGNRTVAGELADEFHDWSSCLPVHARETKTQSCTSSAELAQRWSMTNGSLTGEIKLADALVRMTYHSGSTSSTQALKPGRPDQHWVSNCLALGAAAGFVGDWILDSMHQVQSAALRWLKLRPRRESSEILGREYNRLAALEAECLRDLHAAVFVPHSSDLSALPDSLAHRYDLYRATGRVALFEGESVSVWTWVQLWTALGVFPRQHDVLADQMDGPALQSTLARIAREVDDRVRSWPLAATPATHAVTQS